MNKNLLRTLLVVGSALLLILAVSLLSPGQAEAAFANVGLPARCYSISFSTSFYLTCVTPSGSGVSFVGNQRVPNGYYFLVTDVMVTAEGGTASSLIDFELRDCYGDSYVQSYNRFRHFGGETFAQHFNAPMWVLLADHRLQVVPLAGNEQDLQVRVNGFLVTNTSYVPVVISP